MMSRSEETKAILLREMNGRRAKKGKAPLDMFPEIGCTSCGELSTANDRLFEAAVPYIKTCQKCVLEGVSLQKASSSVGGGHGMVSKQPYVSPIFGLWHRSNESRTLFVFSVLAHVFEMA
jgi:hypothetical protein